MHDYSLPGLFLSAFISSTLFPGGSEAILVYLLTQTETSVLDLWWVASVGNTLGGMTSWLIGFYVSRRYPAQGLIKPEQKRVLSWVQHWGSPALLFSWLPFVGDALCVVAGWLRIHWFISLLMIFIGKAARYAVIIYWLH